MIYYYNISICDDLLGQQLQLFYDMSSHDKEVEKAAADPGGNVEKAAADSEFYHDINMTHFSWYHVKAILIAGVGCASGFYNNTFSYYYFFSNARIDTHEMSTIVTRKAAIAFHCQTGF